MSLNFPDPTVTNPWTDPNGTDWSYDPVDGWRRAPVAENTNDPWVFGPGATGTMVLGQYPVSLVGENNTILGVDTASALTVGKSNVLVGTTAAKNAIDIQECVIVGSKAAENLAVGASYGNVIIGDYALGSLTECRNSVLIGRASRPLAEGSVNEIVIGADAVGKGSNTTYIGTSTTEATYLKGVVIGSSYTVATLPTAGIPDGALAWATDTAIGAVHCSFSGGVWKYTGTNTEVTV